MRMHLTATKSYLARIINEEGPETVLEGFTGSKEEALQVLMADPREVFPVGPCDNQDEHGYCKGHDEPSKTVRHLKTK